MKLKKYLKLVLIGILLFSILLLSSCDFIFGSRPEENNHTEIPDKDESNNDNHNVSKKTISNEYWGTWIRMDTGDPIYIDDECVYEQDDYYNRLKISQYGISGYELDSPIVLKKDNLRFFKHDGNNRSFSFTVSGFEDTVDGRAISLGHQNIIGKRHNKNNESDTETVKVDSSGNVKFTDAVSGDQQSVVITVTKKEPDNTTNNEVVAETKIDVTPSYDGENMGTIPIVEADSYGFKVTYDIDSNDQGFCFGNSYENYTLNLHLNNIGSKVCKTSFYNVSCDDPNLLFVEGEKDGNFSTIHPGDSKDLQFKVRYSTLTSEYVDVPIKISITDSKYQKTWNDSVILRFYKGEIPLCINARNFEQYSSSLKGFLIYPDGRSQRFTVSPSYTETVMVPWSERDYILVFSGATAQTEMCYSFGFSDKTQLADLSGTWKPSDVNSYEDNDSIHRSVRINDLTKPVKSYLWDGDIDFYTINNSSINSDSLFSAIEVDKNFKFTDNIDVSSNNGDGIINPGEQINFDVGIHNTGRSSINGLKTVLSTTSNYISFLTDSKDKELNSYSFGEIYGHGYSTAYYYNRDCYVYDLNWAPYKIKVSKDTPYGTKIPITVTITDSLGTKWTDTIEFEVQKREGDIELAGFKFTDGIDVASNNSDGIINPGEQINFDVGIHNTGRSTISGIKTVLSSTSRYVSFLTDSNGDVYNSYSFGSLQGRRYSSANNPNRTDSCYFDLYWAPYKIKISKDTPYGTIIPITVTITDSLGTEWTDIINFEVQKREGDIELAGFKFTDGINIDSNNSDGIINPGEQINFDVGIYNNGSSTIKGIKTLLSTTSNYVSFLTDSNGDVYNSYSFGSLQGRRYSSANNPNRTDSCYFDLYWAPYKIKISNDTPIGTKIPITVKIIDSLGTEWTDLIYLEVKKPDGNIVVDKFIFSDFENYSSKNNGNGTINPGETITFDIGIRNIGSSELKGVKSVITPKSSFVSVEYNSSGLRCDTFKHGTISSGYYSTGYYKNSSYSNFDRSFYPYKIKISDNVPYGTKLPIEITVTDSYGSIWTDTIEFEVKLRDAKIEIDEFRFIDSVNDSAANNGDGIINPGETIRFDIAIHNVGKNALENVTSNISTTSYSGDIDPQFSSFDHKVVSGNVYSTASGHYSTRASFDTSKYPYKMYINPYTTNGTKIPVTITVTDKLNETWEGVIEFTVSN